MAIPATPSTPATPPSGGTENVDMSTFGLGEAPNGVEIPNNGLGTGVDPDFAALDSAIEAAFRRGGQEAVDELTGAGAPDEPSSVDGGDGEDGGPPSTVIDGAPAGESELGGEEDGTGATGDSIDFASQFQQIYGRPATGADVQNMLGVLSRLGNLPPEQQAEIDAYITGQRPTLFAPPPEPVAPEPDPLLDEYKDDPLYQRITQLQAEQASLQEQVRAQAQDRVARQQVDIQHAIEVASEQFATTMELSDIEKSALEGAVAQSRTFPSFMQMANGDPAVAMQNAMDYHYWRTPEFRDRQVEKEVVARTARTQEHDARKGRAASVTGTGGNGTSRTTPPPKVLSSDDRWGAVAAELKEVMSNGSPN